MKKALFTFALMVVCGVCAAQTSVGYVDIERVTAKAGAVTDAVREATDGLRELQKQMEDKTRAATDLDVQVRNDSGVLSKDLLEAKRKERTRLEGEVFDLEREIRLKERSIETDVFAPLQRNLLYAIEDVAKTRKMDLVVNSKNVLYGSTDADITQAVIDRLNERSKGDAAPVAANAPKTPTNAKATPTPKAAEVQTGGDGTATATISAEAE